MRARSLRLVRPSCQVVCAAVAVFVFVSAANAQSASGRDDRLALMVNGQTLTNTDGGWGASATWLHNFSANTILGLGGEHQEIGDARWSFGRLSLNHGFGSADTRTNLYVEALEGRGEDAIHDYDYSIVTAGIYQNFTKQLSLQLEDKQIDVDTAKGNLPKLSVAYLWTPRLSTSVAYAHSVSGTLDTRLWMGRIDGYAKTVNMFAGLANGQAAPIIFNLPVNIPRPGFILHEYYVGIGRDFSRADTKMILDYIRLGESNHWTLTFNATLHRRTAVPR